MTAAGRYRASLYALLAPYLLGTEGLVDVEDLAGEELARPFYGRASVDEVIATAIRRAAPFFKPR